MHPNSDWKEWIKTADIVTVPIKVEENLDGAAFILSEEDVKAHPTAGKIIRQSLNKGGHIRFENGKITITDCTQCHACHDIPTGCHAYNSLKIPQGEKKVKSINCFDDHAPKRDWLVSYFDLQNDFFTEHTLGPNMFTHFKRFLRDAQLIDGNVCTDFSALICDLGWEQDTALALILVNLAYENAQFEWYITQMDIGCFYEGKLLKERLMADDMKEKAANSIMETKNPVFSMLSSVKCRNSQEINDFSTLSDTLFYPLSQNQKYLQSGFHPNPEGYRKSTVRLDNC